MKRLTPFLLIILALACQKKQADTAPESSSSPVTSTELATEMNLNTVIIQTPPSVISATARLDIHFRKPIMPAHFNNIVLDENPFKFDPDIKGHAEWVSPQLLRFVPDATLPPGTKFKAVLKGKIALGNQKNVDDFRFNFKVAEQEIIAYTGSFNPVENRKDITSLNGTLTFAQNVDISKIDHDISLKGPAGRIALTLSKGKLPGKIKFSSANIERTSQPKNFTLILPGKYTADKKNWNATFHLTAKGVFRVISHVDMTPPLSKKLSYGFRFSDPLLRETELSAYVDIEPDVDFSVRAQGKYLYIEGNLLPGQNYTARLAKGLPSAYGGKMAEEYEATFFFNNIKPEIHWISDGVYLPNANNFKLQFKSVNVRRLKVRITEILPQNIGFFLQHNVLEDRSRTNTNTYSAFEYEDLGRVGENIYNKTHEITLDTNQWTKTELDLDKLFKGKTASLFVVSLNFHKDDLCGRAVNNRNQLKEGDLFFEGDNYYSNPAQYGYYYSKGTINKLLISSDIGLTIKEAGDKYHVYATDVQTARPISGLEIALYSYQNRKLETVVTDNKGMALFRKKGSYVMSSSNRGIALMKLNHKAWQINNFDVSGASAGQSGNNAYIYTDRGVYRPGDTIHLSAICRSNNAPPPERQPVKLTVSNALGQLVMEKQQPAGKAGHLYFEIPTEADDPTGSWNATLSYGGSKFNAELRVETVTPNRIKISMDIPQKIIGRAAHINGKIKARYLFGTPAAKLRTVVTANLSGRIFHAAEYPEFQFNTPLKSFSSRYKTLLDHILDDDGTATFDYAMENLSRAPGIIEAELNTTVYEKGGNFTEYLKSILIYPYTAFAGIKNVFNWGHTLTDEAIALPIISVDTNGKAVEGHRLIVKHYVNNSHWWYDYDNNDRRDFRRMSTTQFISETEYISKNVPIIHNFTAEDCGRHYIEVIDKTSGHETGLFFYASPWGDTAAKDEKDRNNLQISCDRNVYNIGDVATLSFDSPANGIALYTLEQGSSVIEQKWVSLGSPQTSFEIPITSEMLPNCYVSLSLIQPHNQNSNDVPMRIYGIKLLRVEDAATRLPISFTAPEELRPKEDFTLSIHSESDKKASFTVAIVDEGLLDLTGFQTPSPWNHYFRKLGLHIRTTDNYDQIMGLLLPDMDRYFSIGGGLMAEAMQKRLDKGSTKRFIPVVLYQQPMTIAPGKTMTLNFTMPNYVGSVRIMIVAAAGHSYTSLEKTVPVRQPLMILPTVPRTIHPGDVFSLPVSVFAMDSSVSEARISLALSANLKIDGHNTRSILFGAPGEEDIAFNIVTGSRIGTDTITVTARSSSASTDYTVHLPVTSPNPFYTEITDTTVMKDESLTLIPEKFGLKGTNKARIAFTRMPDIQISKRINDLIRYPYGCIEQITSAAFSQLFMADLASLTTHEEQAITQHINATIEKLSRFKINNGFSYWPMSNNYQSHYHDWSSSYVGHFLLEARSQGYHIPPSLFKHWLDNAQAHAKTINIKNHRYQAYRLFLLALAEKPNMGAMNLLRENYLQSLDPLSRTLLAAAYSLNGQKAIAEQITRATPTEFSDYREMAGTLGSTLRDQSLMAYLYMKMDNLQTAARLVQIIGGKFHPYAWYSTQETAMSIMALGTYVNSTDFTGGSVKFHMNIEGKGTSKMKLDGYQKIVQLEDAWNKKITITTDNNNPLFVTLMVEGIPIESRINTNHNGIVLTRNFYDEEGRPMLVDTISQGTPFWAVYRIQSQHATSIENLALSALFPAGWEIVNLRLTGQQPPHWVEAMNLSEYDFKDIRDDRVNWFFNLPATGHHTFAVKINPSFKGEYVLPPVTVEGMYSPEFYARIKGSRVTVL
ncbi:hypothetical protein KAR48_20230 [bacterium]|nr:hypothetical protein [bacterium]